MLIDNGVDKNDLFSYNFACPDIAHASAEKWNEANRYNDISSGQYSCIFNLCIINDLVAHIPGLILNDSENDKIYRKFGITKYYCQDWSHEYNTTINPDGEKIGHFHDPVTYIKAMCAPWPSRVFSDVEFEIKFNWSLFQCPVDVRVTDDGGGLLGEIINGEPRMYSEDVALFTLGDAKLILSLPETKVRFRISATDTGTMTCTFGAFRGSEDSLQSVRFEQIGLEPGKLMSVTVDNQNVEKTKMFLLDGKGNATAEILQDGSEWYDVSMRISTPTAATYKMAFTVSAEVNTLPAGARIEWTANNAKVQLKPSADGLTCSVNPEVKGSVTLTATAYSADGAKLAQASQAVTVRYEWWQWLIIIFLFGWLWY